jgi:hypothetical protein
MDRMKNFMFLLCGLMLAKFSMGITEVKAAVMDQAAHDMLTSTSEDENVDSVSRWGETGVRRKHATNNEVKYNLQPIGEGSFEQLGSGTGRAPASVRAPAGAVDGVIVQPTDRRAAPKSVARAAVNKKAVQEVSVIANDYGFFPSTIIVTQGIPVRLFITGASQRSQCFMLDSFGVRRQIRSNKIEEVTFTPDQSGNFAFTCPMNGAKGSVVVKELEVGERMPASVNAVAHEDTERSEPSTFSVEKKPVSAESLIEDKDFGF